MDDILRIEDLEKTYITFYKEKGYKVCENRSIVSKEDPTLLLVNSTIALFKENINNLEFIPDTAHVQDCFRANGDFNNPSMMLFFKMFGNVAMVDSMNKVLDDLISFLIEVGQIPSNQIFSVIHNDDLDLQAAWQSTNLSKNMVLIKEGEANQYSTRWTYGEGYDFKGRGLTIVGDNPTFDKCSKECDIKCDCSKYLPLGNLIIIESNNDNNKYIETGFGLERVAAYKFYNDTYLLPEFKSLVDSLMNIGFEKDLSKKIINLTRGIFKLIQDGVIPANKKEGYILKSIIRYLTNEIIIYVNKDLSAVKRKYEIIYRILNTNDLEINDNKNAIVVYEMEKYISGLYKAIPRAEKSIIKNKHLDDKNLINNIISTYGLPEFIVVDIMKNIRKKVLV